jgi:hypothetical protein
MGTSAGVASGRQQREDRPTVTLSGSDPSRPPAGTTSVVGTFLALVLGGAAVGALVVLVTLGTDDVALAVGALTLPMVLGLGFATWRSMLGAWLAAKLGRAMLRSRGDEERFRDEVRGSFGEIRDAGLGALPFSWVFVPIGVVVGLVAGVILALLGGIDRPAGPALLAAAATGYGILLRRLARAGRLPLPNE